MITTTDIDTINTKLYHAAGLFLQIKDTETKFNTAVSGIRHLGYPASNLGKLISDINSSGKTLSQVKLKLVDNKITLVDSLPSGLVSVSNSIKDVIAPIFGKEINQNGVELTKRAELNGIAADMEKIGIRRSTFDSLVQSFSTNSQTQIILPLSSVSVTLTDNDPRVVYSQSGKAYFVLKLNLNTVPAGFQFYTYN